MKRMNIESATIARRTLGKTGFAVSEIGFGAWAIGGNWGETVEETDALGALHAAADAGTNFIDTADVYGDGRSEELIGKFLRERGGEFTVATKMGRGAGFDSSYATMEKCAAASAKRLGVETLDLVQLHCLPLETMRGEVWDNFAKLQQKGLFRFYGASVESVEEALFCIRETGCATLQVIFNIFRQKLIGELFPVAREANIGIIARVPLASGILSGKYQPNHQFNADDHRNFNANGEAFNVGETFAGVPFEKGVELAEKVRAIVGESAPLSGQALRWILDFAEVSSVIPGARNASQAQQNAAAAALPKLSPTVHAALEALYQAEIETQIRGSY